MMYIFCMCVNFQLPFCWYVCRVSCAASELLLHHNSTQGMHFYSEIVAAQVRLGRGGGAATVSYLLGSFAPIT